MQGKAYVGEQSPGDIIHLLPLGIQCLIFRALGPELLQSNLRQPELL